MIQNLDFENLKGKSRQLKCERLNLIVGPNGSGKSGLLLAVQYAVTGRTPTSDQPWSIMQYASDSACRVEAKLEKGFQWARICERHPYTAAITSLLRVEGENGPTRPQLEALVAEKIGNFAPMMNIAAFLSAPAEKRRAIVLNLMTGPDSEAADRINRELEAAKAELSDATIKHKGLVASVRAMTTRNNDPTNVELPLRTRGEIQVDIDKNKGELASANERLGEEKGKRTALKSLRKQLDRANEKAAECERKLDEHKQTQDKLDAWSAELAIAKSVVDQPEPPEVSTEKLDGFNVGRIALVDQSKAQYGIERDLTIKLSDQKVLHKLSAIRCVECNDWVQLRDLIASLDHGNAVPEFQQVLDFVDERLKERNYDKLKDVLANAEREIADLDSLIKTNFADIADGVAVIAKADLAIEAEENEIAGLRNKRLSALAERALARQAILGLEARIENWCGTEKTLSANVPILADECVAIEKQLAAPELEAGESSDSLQELAVNLEGRGKQLAADLSVRQEQDSLDANVAELTEDAHKSEAAVGSIKAKVAKLKTQRDDALHKMMQPLVGEIEKFTGEPCYVKLTNDKGTAIFELGVVRDTNHIPLDSLSGGERALFCVGLVVAMTRLADPPEKFLLIEAAELDIANLQALLERIARHAEDFQAFVAVIRAPGDISGWSLHNFAQVPV